MRKGVIASAALHLGIIGAAMVSWPTPTRFSDDPLPNITVELVTVAETTNIAPTVRPASEPVRTPDPTPLPPPPAPIQPQITAQPQLALADLAPPEPEPEPEAVPEPEPPPPPPPPSEPRPVQAQASNPPRAPAVPRARPQPEPQQRFDLDSVLALLDREVPRDPPPQSAPVSEATVRGIGAQNALTMDIRDALLSQMRECWNVPVGAPNPQDLVVQVRVYLARNGDLAQSPQLTPETRAAAGANAYMRTAAEAALRAVNVCAPYRNLPVDRYDIWREIVMTFDPSRMTGR